MKGFLLGLAVEQRRRTTQKSPYLGSISLYIFALIVIFIYHDMIYNYCIVIVIVICYIFALQKNKRKNHNLHCITFQLKHLHVTCVVARNHGMPANPTQLSKNAVLHQCRFSYTAETSTNKSTMFAKRCLPQNQCSSHDLHECKDFKHAAKETKVTCVVTCCGEDLCNPAVLLRVSYPLILLLLSLVFSI